MTRTLGSLMEVARIQSEINRLFDNLLDLGQEEPGGAWMPNVDISETAEQLSLKVELPGVAPETLCLSVHGGNVIIRGQKAELRVGVDAQFHRSERVFGDFRRVIQIGIPVNTRQATAELSSGLLCIRFPKVPNRRGEEVAIEVQIR